MLCFRKKAVYLIGILPELYFIVFFPDVIKHSQFNSTQDL